MQMCRACMSSDKAIVPIDEKFIINYNLLTNLNIAMNDGLPQFSCCSCLDTVHLFIKFKEKSNTSESTLQKNLASKIKSEEFVTENIFHDVIKVNDCIKDEIEFEYKNEQSISDSYEPININDNIDNTLLTERKDFKPKRKRGRPKKKLNVDSKIDKEIKILQKTKRTRSEEFTSKCNKINLDDVTKEEFEEEGQLFCGLCSRSCDEKTDLITHLESHKESRYCKKCSERFDSWSQQLAHRLKHVPKEQMRCVICSKRYVSCDYLEFHYRNVHFEEEGKNLTCKVCLSSYATPRNLKKHTWAAHSEKKYTCDYCSKLFHSKSSLRGHIEIHTENKAYSCVLCDFKSKTNSGLKDHQVRRHTVGKVYCQVCCRPFSNQQRHDKHKCRKQPTICPICGIQINKHMNLKRHIDTHSDVQKYECTRCPSKFKTKSALNDHQDRHDGIRRRQCEYCSDKFYAISSLIKHRRIHTGEKPYVCKICNKGFTGNYNLKVHMKVHGEHNLIKKKNKDLDSD